LGIVCHDQSREDTMAGEQSLDGRVAVVTGAASGMGRVMARSLAGAGARVAAVDIAQAGLDKLETEAPFTAQNLSAIVADTSQPEDCKRAVERTLAAFGRLDVLINCAGVSMRVAGAGRPRFYEADPEGWQRILMINTIGPFLMARFAAATMLNKGWGRIINVTTSFDTMLAAGLSAYGASKSALEASSAIWAKELDGTGVTVNVLVPGGPTDTPGFFPPGAPRPPVLLDAELMGPPIRWLVSPASDGITGARFIARNWDTSLPPDEAAARVRAPIGWPELAKAAEGARGAAI
jgi:NAD(P)-dependent dehydrogenase (short-subunit alcohol dehydrogenase family)